MSEQPMGILKFHARRDQFFGDGVDLFFSVVCDAHGGRTIYRAEPIVFKKLDPIDTVLVGRSSDLSLTKEAAQQLMDELWHVGLRPTEGTGSAGSLAATERHLADMRHLVFKTKPTK